ncbi:hypothetical protein [Morganella morganii]|uniref:hypothetical protein n=1 Tax=Morganella morganii TaxID=582 RepID=UPI0030FF2774
MIYLMDFITILTVQKKIAIDSFRSDKGGITITSGISADGRVITGSAETDDGAVQAFHFRHAEGKMTRLGTLRTGNTGNSYVRAASADGRVIAGMSQTDSSASGQAFRYKEGGCRYYQARHTAQ